jgi:transposase InsO family protein
LAQQEQKAYLSVLINQIRKDHPTMALRSMYYKLSPITIGRDAFEEFAKQLGYKATYRRLGPRTTDSTGVVRFDDLLSGKTLRTVDEAWSSDITYFEIKDRFYYITFILDCYSRRILGYSVSKDLTTENTTLCSLRRAIKTRNGEIPAGLIFHSDGGGQYYSKVFLQLTQAYGIRNSMCEMAYENGKAERLNGVIKNNYLRHWKIDTYEKLRAQVDRAVRLYNTSKPHKSLKRKTPVDFENETLNLHQRTKPTMTKSFDAETKIIGASSPVLS